MFDGSVIAGLSHSKNGVGLLAYAPAIHPFTDDGARIKSAHDDG
jgi:hypothetical protein